jgi:DNA-binding transcriptional ArsR family regulator
MNFTFKALSDPARRQILRLLRGRELTATELVDHFRLSQPTLSHHFAVLKKARLVRFRREGPFVRYSINHSALKDAMAWLAGTLA